MTPQFDLRALGGYQQMQPMGGPQQFMGGQIQPQGGPQQFMPPGMMPPMGGPQQFMGGGQMPWMGGPPQMIGPNHSQFPGYPGMGPGRGGIDLSQLMGQRRMNPMGGY